MFVMWTTVLPVGFFLDGEILGWSEEFSEPVFLLVRCGVGNLTDDAAWRAYVHFDQDGYSFSDFGANSGLLSPLSR